MVRKFLVGAAGGGAALALIFGATANANPYDAYAGLTFAQVQERNGNAKIGTRVGEYLPTEECIVTGSRRINGTLLVDLNCNDKYAGKSGHPGNSAASEAGKSIAKMKARGAQYSEQYARAIAAGKQAEFWCGSTEDALNWCRKVCDEGGTCSGELAEFLS